MNVFRHLSGVSIAALALMCGLNAAAQTVVVFPDANLEAAVREAINKPTGDIYTTDLVGAEFTSLQAGGRGIADLTGLENCADLAFLDLSHNLVTDITPVASLSSLTVLGLSDNQIASLPSLTDIPGLTELYLDDNALSDITNVSSLGLLVILDASGNSLTSVPPLYSSPLLDYVNLANNMITDVTGFGEVSSVSTINLSGNQISDITTLGWISGLTSLNLAENLITDISPLSTLTNLTELYLGYNQIADLTPLSSLTGLTDLSVLSNAISGLAALSGLTNLSYLDLSENSISDITSLSGLTALSQLMLNGNTVAVLTPLASLTGLTQLGLWGNQCQDLGPLSGLTGLDFLDLGSNAVTDISPLTGLTSLTVLSLSANTIQDLTPLAGLTSLQNLFLDLAGISSLEPLQGLTGLTQLCISDNLISDVTPLAGLVNLLELYAYSNNITDIAPLAGLVHLTSLYVGWNRIESIAPVASLTDLVTLDAVYNRFGDISALSGLTKLATVNLGGNKIVDGSPLTANTGIDSGDSLNLEVNPLSQTTLCTDIPELAARGVSVQYTGTCEGDTDGDGLADDFEALLGTNPNDTDSDGDALSDWDELLTHDTNPTLADTDEDGLDDGSELLLYDTDPLNWDTDGDAVSDGMEVAHETSPTDPSSFPAIVYRVTEFYRGVKAPDGMVSLDSDTLMAAQGYPRDPAVLQCRRSGRFSSDDVFSPAGSPYVSPDGLLQLWDDRFLVSDGDAGAIFEVPPAGGAPSVFLSPVNCRGNMDVLPSEKVIKGKPSSGSLIVPSFEPPAVLEVDPVTREVTTLVPSSFFDGPGAGAVEVDVYDPCIYVTWQDAEAGLAPARVYRFDLTGAGQVFLQLDDFDYAWAKGFSIEVDAEGRWLYYAYPVLSSSPCGGGSVIFRRSLSTTRNELVAAFDAPCRNIELSPGGASLFVAMGDRVYEITVLDSDGDGLPDDWESLHGLDPFDATGVNGVNGDPDADTVPNGDEYSHGADPQNSDSDYDGLTDGGEVNTYLTMPSDADTDRDGISDPDEISGTYGFVTSPVAGDTDYDESPDGVEIANGTDPLDPLDFQVTYVDQTATGLADGSSWADAFTEIQGAVDAVAASGGGIVWVAQGGYAEAVEMRNWVAAYGGFEGLAGLGAKEEPRDSKQFETIIDGRDVGDGVPAKHVVIMAYTEHAVLDGFTVTGGAADAATWMDNTGGGILCQFAGETNRVAGCTVRGNSALVGGGIACTSLSNPAVERNVVAGNTAEVGGGMFFERASSQVLNCVISANAAYTGGGLACAESSPTLVNCVISGNDADATGGAILLVSESFLDAHGCTISSNKSLAGGGIYCGPMGTHSGHSSAEFVNTIFNGNAGVAVYEGEPASDAVVENCLFFDNPQGDFLDENAGVYTGAADINLYVVPGGGNIDGDPQYAVAPSGTWTAAVYDAIMNETTLTDETAPFTPDTLSGTLIRPRAESQPQALVVANTASEIVVQGDVTGSVAAGTTYEFVDHHLQPVSPCIDAGAPDEASYDIDSTPRPQGAALDIGAFEFPYRGLATSVVGEGSIVLDPAQDLYLDGAVVDVTAEPASGWRFDHWDEDLTGTENPTAVTLSRDMRVTAVFVQTFTLTVAVDGNGTTSPSVGVHVLDAGTVAPLSATPETGWRFAGWSGDVAAGATSVTMDADKAVTAQFIQTFTLTMTVAGSGTTDPAAGAQVFDAGTVVPLSATPDTGWRFAGWSGDVAADATSVTMDADKSVTAQFIQTFTLTLTVAGNGTTDPAAGAQVFDAGTVVPLSATPETGWRFAGWSGDVAADATSVTMDADKSIEAAFVRIEHTLTTAVSGNGSVDPSPGVHTYDYGTNIQVTATEEVGSDFDHWDVDGIDGGAENPVTITLDADRTVTAVFVLESRELTVAVNPSEGGTVDPAPGAYSYDYGTSVTLTATPYSGWEFARWEMDDSTVQYDNPLTIVLTDDRLVTAVYEQTDRTLTVSVEGQGTVEPEAGQHVYAAGTVVALSATPATGWYFYHWDGNVRDPLAAATTITMNEDETVTAVFAATPSAGMVSGIVMDRSTNAPLANVLVQAFNAATGVAAGSTETSAAGRYGLATTGRGIPLRIAFGLEGYESKTLTGIYAPTILNLYLASTAPAAPTGLDAAAGAGEIAAWWEANREPDLAGYAVWRADGSGAPAELTFTRLNSVLVATPSYRDTSLGDATAYTYYVTAVDHDGNESGPSETVVVHPGVITVWLPDVQGPVGEEVRVPINARNATGITPWGMDIKVLYDPSLVSYVDSTSVRVERTAVTADLMFASYAPEPGRVNITCLTEGDPLKGVGHLFDLYFTLRDDVDDGQCSEVGFQNARFYDVTPAPLSVDYSDAGLLCTSLVCNAGDLNDDGVVDSADVIIALQIAVEQVEPDACQQIAGDLNGDGAIDSADALMIQRLAVGLPLNPPQPDRKALRPQDVPLKSLLKDDEGKSVEINSEEVTPGDTVTVPLDISDANGLSGLDLEISFPEDKAMVSLISVEPGELMGEFDHEESVDDGHVTISMSSDTALLDASGEGGTLVELTFQVTENAPVGLALPVRLSNADLKGPYGESFDWYVPVETVSGSLTVEDQSQLQVTPLERNVSAASGATTFAVANGGSGSMLWSAEVTAGSEWLAITSGEGGTNEGTIEAAIEENVSTEARTATICITAGTALGSPATVTVVQAGVTTYTLTMEVEGQGSVEPALGAHVYEEGTEVPVTATAADGWQFDHWDGDVTDAGAESTTVVMDADQTVTAVFKRTCGCIGGPIAARVPSKPFRDAGGDVLLWAFVAVTLLLARRNAPQRSGHASTVS